MKVFAAGGDIYCASASQMFHVPVVKHGINGHLRQKGKIAELALGYGGSVGALKAMGAIEMGIPEEELQPLVAAWRTTNPHIVKLWWDIDRATKKCVKEHVSTEAHGIHFKYQSGCLFLQLPSGRRLSYVKPRIALNRFGKEAVTYEGIGSTKKWERLESYGAKFVENIVQATSRDILAEAMERLNEAGFNIVMHVHDEVIIEAPCDVSLTTICTIMGQPPNWADGLLLHADGYVCDFYQKD
jgi:DNA polymerase